MTPDCQLQADVEVLKAQLEYLEHQLDNYKHKTEEMYEAHVLRKGVSNAAKTWNRLAILCIPLVLALLGWELKQSTPVGAVETVQVARTVQ